MELGKFTVIKILALSFLTATVDVKGAEVPPTDWPAECRWPDRSLQDGRVVNLRPLFDWLTLERKRSVDFSYLKLPERERKIQEVNRKRNPMPVWLPLYNCNGYSSTGDTAIVMTTERVVIGYQKPRGRSLANTGGFTGNQGSRDPRVPIYGEKEGGPTVILNHPK